MKRYATALSGTLGLLALIVAGFQVAAAAPDAASVEELNRLPDIVVERVSVLGNGSYLAGETVRGEAEVQNPSSYPARGTLELGLVSGGEGGEYGDVYAIDDENPEFSLAAGASAKIPFEIKTPNGVSGQGIAVMVKSRLVGSLYRGWGFSPRFSIEGDGAFAVVESAYFAFADGSTRGLEEGPTIYPTGPQSAVDIRFHLRGGAAPVSVTPSISAKQRGTGEMLSIPTGKFSVAPGTTTVVSVPFKNEGQAPGVYEGEVVWRDGDGAERASLTQFRFIIPGEAATVHSARISPASVEKGDEFSVTLAVSGTPIDVMAEPPYPDPVPARVIVGVTNADGETVAEAEDVRAIPLDGEISLGMTAEIAAAAMSAEVKIIGSKGQALFARTYPLEGGIPSEVPPQVPENRTPFLVAAVASALLLAAAGFSSRAGRRRATLAFVLVAALAWAFAYRAAAFTYTATGGDQYCGHATIYVNQPGPGAVFSVGENVTVSGNVSYNYCANAESRGKSHMVVTNTDTGVQAFNGNVAIFRMIGIQGGHDHPWWTEGFYRPLGALPKGYYRIRINAVTETACVSSAAGFQDFIVDEAGAPTSCAVDKLRTVLGDPTTWTATGCDTECVWENGAVGTVHTKTAGSVGTFGASVHSRKTIHVLDENGNWAVDADGNYVTRVLTSAPRTCDTTVVVEDLCDNIDGVQNPIPAGMVRNAGGACVCPEGTMYDTVDERCEDGRGYCATCRGGGGACPTGTKYCDGVCVDDAAACAAPVVVTQCPVVPENQYCVEIFDRNGARTGQLADIATNEDLEKIFGYALPDAFRDQARARAAGQATYPIWGVAGRVLSETGTLNVNYASSGCGGSLCAYSDQGCLTTVDTRTGDPVANCSPVNDVPGSAGVGPQAILEVEPSLIGRGGQCDVYWSSHEMRTCQVTGTGVTSAALAGSAKTPALEDSATYTLTCTGIDGRPYSDSDSCTVDPDVIEF